MRRYYLALAVCVLAIGLTGLACSERAVPIADFRENECAFDLPDGIDEEEVRCGVAIVPESRSGRSDASIELAVAVFQASEDDAEADPLVYLSGGPGGGSLEGLAWMLDDSTTRRLLRDRDLVFIDQRGTGLSAPELDCPELGVANRKSAAWPSGDERSLRETLAAVAVCRERLAEDGIDAGSYTTVENAADIPMVLRALGYREWNLYGVSYGTRLAQAIMRDHPEGLRSVVLDSPVPLGVSAFDGSPHAFQRSLDMVVEACNADDACREEYGDIGGTLESIVLRLEASPVNVETFISFDDEEAVEVYVDGARLLDGLRGQLYSAEFIRVLPEDLRLIAEGDESMLSILAAVGVSSWNGLSMGMFLSVTCSEELSLLRQSVANGEARPDGIVGAVGLDEREDFITICEHWEVAPAEAREQEAVLSSVPTLILSGHFDPITPPAYGERVAAGLKHASLFTFGNESHGLLGSTCPTRLVRDFLAEPDKEPEPRCEPADLALDFYLASDFEGLFDLEPFADADCWGERIPDCLETNAELDALAVDPALCQGAEARVCLVPIGQVRTDVVQALIDFHRESAGIEVLVLPSLALPAALVSADSSQVTENALYDLMVAAYGISELTPSTFIGLTPVDIRPEDERWGWMFGARFGSTGMGLNHGVFSYFRMANVEPYDGGELNDELLYERAAKYMARYVAVLHLDYPFGEDADYLNYQDMWGLADLDGMGMQWPEGPAPCLGEEPVICIIPDNDYLDPAFADDLDAVIERLSGELDVRVESRVHRGYFYPTQESWSEEYRNDLHQAYGPLFERANVTVIGVTDDALAQAATVAPHLDAVWPEERLGITSAHGAGQAGTLAHQERLYRLLLRTILQTHYGEPLLDEPGHLLSPDADEPTDLDGVDVPALP